MITTDRWTWRDTATLALWLVCAWALGAVAQGCAARSVPDQLDAIAECLRVRRDALSAGDNRTSVTLAAQACVLRAVEE